ncbi:MAG TPA: DUF1501 domain-containing protein [Candidatus Acidoferrum sp.]|nr:DUF1501 domain-containing protein [Candidatus Acidoferrum sp.]
MKLHRRQLLQTLGAGLLLPLLPGLSLSATGSAGQKRFVLVILRGAMDGLAAVPPYGDANLAGLRKQLLVGDGDLLKLDSFFALHPQLKEMHGMFQQKEMEVLHAVATPYRQRSHFDAQNVLETGLDHPDPNADGWLNNLAGRLPAADITAMAIGQSMPKVLQGHNKVGSWTPDALPTLEDDTLQRLRRLYAEDTFLGTQLEQGLQAQAMAGEQDMTGNGGKRTDFALLADTAAKFLAQDHGPSLAVLEVNGWDTHANQGSVNGLLAQKLGELDRGLAALRNGMGAWWTTTQVLVVTEFGRTAAMNGTNGTDHGTASVAFRLGGAQGGLQKPGSVITQWPGLASGSLLDGRDLRPTRDMRELFAAATTFMTS